MKLKLHIKLISDSLCGRGDGVAGLVDSEVEHDFNTGLPYIKGKTIKGLIVEECANILYSLNKSGNKWCEGLKEEAAFLFGKPNSMENCSMSFRTARLPDEITKAVVYELEVTNKWTPEQVLDSLTDIRSQTAIDMENGSPVRGSLRSSRFLLRGLTFTTDVVFSDKPSDEALALLAASVQSLLRMGTMRNRGTGKIIAWLESRDNENFQQYYINYFMRLIHQEVRK